MSSDAQERLEQLVRERKAEGTYPEDIDIKLEHHFARLAYHHEKAQDEALAKVHNRVNHAHEISEFSRPEFLHRPDKPGGEVLRKAVVSVVQPDVLRLYEELQAFAIAVRESLYEIAQALGDDHTHSHRDVRGVVNAALERLDDLERQANATPNAIPKAPSSTEVGAGLDTSNRTS